MIAQLRSLFQGAGEKAFPGISFPVEIAQSGQEKFGHYQFNSAMKIGKMLGKNPRIVAEALLAQLPKGTLIEKVEIAGPGFLNITLSSHFLAEKIEKMLQDSHLDIPFPAKPKKIIVEFSSPNVAKELHVGHLRSTIIGDTIARLFEFLGHDVLRLNHVGDWGTQFGMLIAHLKETHPAVLSGEEKTDLPHLMQWYKESKLRFDSAPEFKKRAQLEVVELQRGEEEALKAWEMICNISRRGYQEIYDLLEISLQERGESTYNPLLKQTVADLEALGIVQLSEGAKCIFLEGFEVPLMIQKSDGGYNYDTTDMAALRQRIEVEKADRIIYITDLGQSLHFQLVFKSAEKAGWWDPQKTQLDHVGFGLVLGQDGKKFKTRSGDTEKLIDLLWAAIDHAEKILLEREPEQDTSSLKSLAKSLGLAAVKYADLSSHRTSDYTFSYDKMLRFEGNTAAFLMYSYVRILGIQRKIGPRAASIAEEARISLGHPSEIALALHIARFEEALDAYQETLLPNRLTDYLFTLAEKFNAFFRDCRVEGSLEMGARLRLCQAAAKVLQQGFEILGLPKVDKM